MFIHWIASHYKSSIQWMNAFSWPMNQLCEKLEVLSLLLSNFVGSGRFTRKKDELVVRKKEIFKSFIGVHTWKCLHKSKKGSSERYT